MKRREPPRSTTHSPDGRHAAEFVFAGEIAFGPEYHHLAIDGRSLGWRTFGDELRWSADSRFLAAQEWLHTEKSRPPVTRVALFDVERRRWSPLRTVQDGWACGFEFEGTRFVYRRDESTTRAQITEVEVEIPAIKNWKQF